MSELDQSYEDENNLPLDNEIVDGEIVNEEHLADSNADEFTEGDSAQDSEVEAVVPNPKKRKSPRSNIQQQLGYLQQERYRLDAEKNQLAAELAQTRAALEQSTKNALLHYEDAARQKLDSAKIEKARAIESQDVESQVKADESLTRAVYEYENAMTLKAQEQLHAQAPRTPQYVEDYIPPPNASNQMHETQAWLASNPWMMADDPSYDPDLAAKVDSYAQQFDKNLMANGKAQWIQSPSYFAQLNKFVNAARQQQSPQSYDRRSSLNMSRTSAPVSPVRSVQHTGQPSRQGAPLPNLMPGDREMYNYWKDLDPNLNEKTYREMIGRVMQDDKARGIPSGRR